MDQFCFYLLLRDSSSGDFMDCSWQSLGRELVDFEWNHEGGFIESQ